MQLSSPDFLSGDFIPEKFTCDGEGMSPTLEIRGVPDGAKSLVLMVDDPDSPGGTFTHWLVWNIPPNTERMVSGTLPPEAIEGQNSSRDYGYMGPCPHEGEHNYIFTLYALDDTLEQLDPKTATKDILFDKMTGHIMVTAELVGLYKRK